MNTTANFDTAYTFRSTMESGREFPPPASQSLEIATAALQALLKATDSEI